MSLEDLRAMVGFVEASVQGFMESNQEEETAFGRMMVFRSTPVFGPPEEDDSESQYTRNPVYGDYKP